MSCKRQKISSGTFSNVFKTTHNGVHFAEKMYKEHKTGSGLAQDFLREITALNILKTHKNIIKMSEITTECSLLMKCAHRNLSEYITTTQSESTYVSWFDQLYDAIDFMHLRGVIHRDIKPSNILVYKQESCYQMVLADFGSSVVLYQKEQSLEHDVCTYPFAAPELLKHEKYDANIDWWSLGVVISELYFQNPMFRGETEKDVLKQLFDDHTWNHKSVQKKLPFTKWSSLLNLDPSTRRPSSIANIYEIEGLNLQEQWIAAGFTLKHRNVTLEWLKDLFEEYKYDKFLFDITVSLMDKCVAHVNLREGEIQAFACACMKILTAVTDFKLVADEDYEYLCDGACPIDLLHDLEKRVAIKMHATFLSSKNIDGSA
mgnify:CR=1 FL=1